MWLREIKERLENRHPVLMPRGNYIPAAVLAPVSADSGQICITILQRTRTVTHPGQLAFPGGHHDSGDENLLHTALRETEEEIGIDRDHIIPLGRLSDQVTPTGYWIRAYVGAIPSGTAHRADPREIQEVLTVPITSLSHFHDSPPMFRYGHHVIWGVTGRLVDELISVLV